MKKNKQKGHVDTPCFFQFYMCIFLWLQKHQVSTFYPGHWAGGTRACDVANTQILLAFKKKKKTWCDVLWHVFAFSRELSRKTSKDRQAASDYRKFHLKAFIVRWRAVNVHPSSQHFNDQSIPPSPPPSISTLIPNNAIMRNNIKLMTCFEMIFFHSARSRLVYSATK